jgi:hypothetical protein
MFGALKVKANRVHLVVYGIIFELSVADGDGEGFAAALSVELVRKHVHQGVILPVGRAAAWTKIAVGYQGVTRHGSRLLSSENAATITSLVSITPPRCSDSDEIATLFFMLMQG